MIYNKGVVLSYQGNKVYITSIDTSQRVYHLKIVDTFKINAGGGIVEFFSGDDVEWNQAFVERHLTPEKGASAQAIRVLYGD